MASIDGQSRRKHSLLLGMQQAGGAWRQAIVACGGVIFANNRVELYTLTLRMMQHEEEVQGQAWAWFPLGAEAKAGRDDGNKGWA